ncbi:uncharacterized protein METZ01_LOCUS178940 [marine metagenome]|uniref:Uncharacterized protein n=1 Tax=marine metagenome TaxID=408172 RepID=A0A382CIX8_9ZZZZ
MMRVTLGNNHFHQYQFFKFYAGKVSHISVTHFTAEL